MQVLASVNDGTVRVWDVHSGEEQHRLFGHEAKTHILHGHPQRAEIAMSGSYDGTVRIWDIVAGQQLAV